MLKPILELQSGPFSCFLSALQGLHELGLAFNEIGFQCEALLQARCSLGVSMQKHQRTAEVVMHLGKGWLNRQRLLIAPDRVFDTAVST